MSPLEPFDFRKLMGKSHQSVERPSKSDNCIIGVAWTHLGIGLVALPLEAGKSVVLPTYNNIALGPIKSDWSAMAAMIQLLPAIFKSTKPEIFLSGAVGSDADHLPVSEEFEKAFPGKVRVANWHDVEDWVGQVMPHIGTPQIPAKHAWSVKPLHAAAETALFFAHRDAKSPDSPKGETSDGE